MHTCLKGGLAAAIYGADLFIGLSVGGIVSQDMVRSMNADPIVFSLANPVPEILPAAAAGAALVASGRFDFPNYCNNVLAFPSLLRGALDTMSPGMCMLHVQFRWLSMAEALDAAEDQRATTITRMCPLTGAPRGRALSRLSSGLQAGSSYVSHCFYCWSGCVRNMLQSTYRYFQRLLPRGCHLCLGPPECL